MRNEIWHTKIRYICSRINIGKHSTKRRIENLKNIGYTLIDLRFDDSIIEYITAFAFAPSILSAILEKKLTFITNYVLIIPYYLDSCSVQFIF